MTSDVLPPVDAESQEDRPRGVWGSLSDQFGFRQLVSDYLIPVESNSVWYLLGGVLAIALGLEVLTESCWRSSTHPTPGRRLPPSRT